MENNYLICPYCQMKTEWGARCQKCEMELSNAEMLYTIAVKHYNNAVSLCKNRHLVKAYQEIETSIDIFPCSSIHLHLGLIIASEIGEFQYSLALLNQMKPLLNAEEYSDTLASLRKAIEIYNEILQKRFAYDGQENLLLIHYYLLHKLDTKSEHPEYLAAIQMKDQDFIGKYPQKEQLIIESEKSYPKVPFSVLAKVATGIVLTVMVVFIFVNYSLKENLRQSRAELAILRGKMNRLNPVSGTSIRTTNYMNEEPLGKLIRLIQKRDNFGIAEILVSDSTLVSLLDRQQLAALVHSLYEEKQYELITRLPFSSQEQHLAKYHVLWSAYTREKAQGKIQDSTLLQMQAWVDENLHSKSYLGEVALALFRYYDTADPALAHKYAVIIRDWVHAMPATGEYKQYLNGPVQRRLTNES